VWVRVVVWGGVGGGGGGGVNYVGTWAPCTGEEQLAHTHNTLGWR